MEQQETTGIGWFIAGLGLGALLGVLFAPKAGRELREGIITGARDSKEYVAARGKQARDQINSVVDRGREQVSSAVDRGRDQVNEFSERGKEAAERGKERWSGIVDRMAGSERPHFSREEREEEEAYRAGTAEDHS